MYNTFGLHSINANTFNPAIENEKTDFSSESRDTLLLIARVSNTVLHLLEWIPFTCVIAGTARMCTGAAVAGLTLFAGQHGLSGKLYEESLETGIAQVARGFAVTTGPTARIALFVLDVLLTQRNIESTITAQNSDSHSYHTIPYKEVPYSPHLFILYFG
jgi:hypothetical protein